MKKKVINYSEESFSINVSSVINNDDDYCTIIQSSSGNIPSFSISAHRCDDDSIRGYPLCRLIRMFSMKKKKISLFFVFLIFSNVATLVNEDNPLIYRLERDTQSGNLTGVTDFCSQLGGYPIYANNAYEWQLIQG